MGRPISGVPASPCYLRRVRWLIAMGAVLVLAPVPAHAFARTTVQGKPDGACLWWAPRTVHYVVNELGVSTMDPADTVAALDDGFGAWMGWDCSDFAYVDDGTTPSAQVGFNRTLVSQPQLGNDVANEHLVVFRERLCSDLVPPNDDCLDPNNDDCDNKYDCWADRSDATGDALAYTLVTSETSTGRILDADTAFDAFDFQFKDLAVSSCDGTVDSAHCADVQNTMAHEAGHFLGLAHSDVDTATMYFRVTQDNETSKRDLDPDDVQGLCAIYPTGQPPVACVPLPPVQVTGRGCSCGEGDALAWPALLAMLGWASRRRRRRPAHPAM